MNFFFEKLNAKTYAAPAAKSSWSGWNERQVAFDVKRQTIVSSSPANSSNWNRQTFINHFTTVISKFRKQIYSNIIKSRNHSD